MSSRYHPDTEEWRLRDQYPREYTEGWNANDPTRKGWPVANNPYQGEQAKAFNTGWNDRTLANDD